ncbi:hypothetical protein DL991_10495 [Amycolatopsis sp. WAC 01375]|uniref:hypothetical protein n=1 Tax=Amycolatopsis sp. WAC 01375 TaxID=2203194 RepID=UPI000F79A615|nr:hypothetical protein [Amycolatopsis sp. WAC 01375]RSM80537.1 hypothetical protein DL991_10495 [Amycolatopsis sp. WAC 01375]
MLSPTHVLAIIKGAARPDRDITAYFGSVRGIAGHLEAAQRLGLVAERADDPADPEAPTVFLTDAGEEFFVQFRLAELSQRRANYWNLSGDDEIADPARHELERRWRELPTPASGEPAR